MLATSHKPVVFVARADIFANPAVAKILRFLKIMPINRIRDGLRSVAHSAEAIDKSIEVLNNKVRFCILSEGTHRPMHSLMPIGKGIARVAYGASLSQEEKVYIVPVGLEYGDYFRYRTTLYAHIGDPVEVGGLLASLDGATEREKMDAIRNAVSEGLKRNIVYIPDDDNYGAVWEMAKIGSGEISPLRMEKRFAANKEAVDRIGKAYDAEPEKVSELFSRVKGFTERRRGARISLEAMAKGKSLWKTIAATAGALLPMPFFLAWSLASLPVWLPAELMVRKQEDEAFKNSFRCGVTVFGWTLMLVIWAVVLFCCLKWYWALAAFVALIPAPFKAYDGFNAARRLVSRWRYLFRKDLQVEYEDLKREIKEM